MHNCKRSSFLQGIPRKRVSDEINKALSDVGLLEQAGVFSKHLSGGQKRKLSIAIACIGDPKVRKTQRLPLSSSNLAHPTCWAQGF